MSLKKRRELPLFCRLDYRFDIQRILDEFHKNQFDNFAKYNDLNPGSELYENALVYREYLHKWFLRDDEISKSLNNNTGFCGESYKQLALTDFDKEKFGRTDVDSLKRLKNDRKMRIVKRASSEDSNYIPEADERNYTKRNHNVAGVFEEILDTFKAPVARVRFAVLMPGFRTATHIDSDTDYTIRIHIPIVTNLSAVFGIQKAGVTKELHLPADGGVWFVNAGFPHYVFNGGTSPRVHLILALSGQDDLPHDRLREVGIWN